MYRVRLHQCLFWFNVLSCSQRGHDFFTTAMDPINMKRSGIVIGANAGKTRVDGGLWIGRAKSIHPDAWGFRWKLSMKPYDTHEVFELLNPNCRFRSNGRNGGHDIPFMRDHQNQNL